MSTKEIQKRFFHSLKCGTGEAYLIARYYPTIDFSAYIIKGALKNYSYDGQSESSRAQYIFDLYLLATKKEKIRKAILEGLTNENKDTWSLTHLFDIAKLFAQQGDQEMRQAIYNRFSSNTIEGSDWVGYSEILELDGLQGLIFIAEVLGKSIELNPDNWQDDLMIKHFQDENPDLEVMGILENLAKENKYIHIYLDNIKETIGHREHHKANPASYKDIIDEVLNSKPFISSSRKRELSDNEVRIIAEQLIRETDKSKIEKLLGVFSYHKFPFDSEIILNFANQKKNTRNKIVDKAIDALKHLRSMSIREFAMDKILNSKNPMDYLEILTSNYQPGNFNILSEIASKTNNEHKIENLARIFTEIFKANKTKECKTPLEVLYNKMNCGIHRNSIVEILIENDVLSDKIKNEIKYDSYLDTRKLL